MEEGSWGRSSERADSRRGSLRARWAVRLVCLTVLTAGLLGSMLPQVAVAGELRFSLTPSKTQPYAVCGLAAPGRAECLAILVPTASARASSGVLGQAGPAEVGPTYSGSGVGGGYAPADLRSAYNLPSASAGSGQTVAIVDAYDDPNAESDLATYRSRYGISACTTGNGCFRKVNQSGGATYPSPDAGWAVEISLDLDMVSAACPNCHILLVEASNNLFGNLFTAEDEAVALGATEISNSWAGEEFAGETSADSYFHHPGVPITASAGDFGYGVEYPAASRYVIAVGGTSLSQASNSRGWSETAWSGTGSGCSAYELKSTGQTDTGCAKRTNNDVAAVASPETPVSVADSYKLPSEFSKPAPGWTLLGGTSVSSPLIAGTMALANAYTRSFDGASGLYKAATQNGTGVLDDVVSGSNGSCGNYLCNAGPGYDGPTGLGSPYGAPVASPNSPTVVTGSASAVGSGSATLNATVNPNGGTVTECKLEYGTTVAYGQSATCTPSPGSGTSPVAVSAALTGLTANTTYHFRISATNAGGTSKGSDQTFTTTLAAHYFSNGVKLTPSNGEANSEEETRVVIGWGTLELKGESGAAAGGILTCHTVSAGLVWNPETPAGAAGRGSTETFAVFACESNICKAGEVSSVQPASLPWPSELIGTTPATFRSRSTGVRVLVTCNGVATAPFEGSDEPLAPAGSHKGSSAKSPGFSEFDPGSGELKLVAAFGGAVLGSSKIIGELKVLGYNEQELIQTK